MEFLKHPRRKTIFSEVLYILLNLLLAIAVFSLVLTTSSPYIALGLVVVSKWRVFAVRPQFWAMNIMSNLVDVIVGVSVVMLLFMIGNPEQTVVTAGGAANVLATQVGILAFYIGWLAWIKHRTTKKFVVAQAGVAQFVGLTALAYTAYDLPVWGQLAVLWAICYASARHVAMVYSAPRAQLFAQIWAFWAAGIGLFLLHWTIRYDILSAGFLSLPLSAIVLGLLGFLGERTLRSYAQHDGVIRMADVKIPALFVSVLLLCLLLFMTTIPL